MKTSKIAVSCSIVSVRLPTNDYLELRARQERSGKSLNLYLVEVIQKHLTDEYFKEKEMSKNGT